jgi:hypothetical protein
MKYDDLLISEKLFYSEPLVFHALRKEYSNRTLCVEKDGLLNRIVETVSRTNL